jgi:2-dehydro-3-deoxyglucarate aldolase
MSSRLKDALIKCRPAFGGWIQIGHPSIAEIMGKAGFDWIAVDAEHAAIDLETTTALLRAMAPYEAVPLVRVPHNDLMWIRRVLDAGAGGVIVPMVNTADDARRAVEAAKYPPAGVRGFGYCRANAYGEEFAGYVSRANDDLVVVAQVEHVESVQNVDAILDVEGIDGVFIGPYDLSGSMGITGQMDHPRMKEARQRVLDACRAHKKSAGLHVVRFTTEAVRGAMAEGFTFIALSIDVTSLHAHCREMVTAARASCRSGTSDA